MASVEQRDNPIWLRGALIGSLGLNIDLLGLITRSVRPEFREDGHLDQLADRLTAAHALRAYLLSGESEDEAP